MRAKDNRAAVMPDNEAALDQQLKTAKGQAEYQGLVRLIAQVLDQAVSGADCNMRIGTTKRRDALIITVYQDGEPMYATGQDWQALLKAAEGLL